MMRMSLGYSVHPCHLRVLISAYNNNTGFVQETRQKYQGLFQDFPAPN